MAERRRKKRDYYEVLGVSKSADDADLKRAYREQARKYHPDISEQVGAEDKFKEINEAYAVLSDPQRRARYDRYGFAGLGEEDVGGFSSVVDAFDDLLSDLFKRRKGKKRGRDLRYTLELTLEEAVFGCDKQIRVPIEGGKSREYAVTVPRGAKDGQVRRLEGKGEKGQGGAGPGDLNVILRVRPHSLFERDGDDIWCEVPVTFPEAALGTVVEVPTLDGKVKMRMPEGTQSGRVFRMRGKGVPKGRAGRGDQMVRVLVETPTGLTDRQRELLEQFESESGGEIAHPQRKTFLDKVRDLLGE
ncbi:MAG: DnaJ domain-containing protein [Deltaproteobacteria bacterium]|nr:DnaJ domain-containing protein [Deltaproteobacteria bacterium]